MKNILSNASYEIYMKDQLQLLSSHFSLKTYKTANLEDWRGFERNKDFRIQIQWKGECIWEWILERSFWAQRNTNKEDRIYMRRHADSKINACRNSLIKKKPIKKRPTAKKAKSISHRTGHTQDLFEKMKKK